MEQYKLGQLISNYEFVVGIMRVIENKSIEAFTTALIDYQKLKNIVVQKSSVRLKIQNTEYVYSLSKVEDGIEDVNNDTYEKIETSLDWDKSLSDNIIKKLIINHYLKNK